MNREDLHQGEKFVLKDLAISLGIIRIDKRLMRPLMMMDGCIPEM